MQKNISGQKIGVQMVSATDGSAFTGAVTVYVTGDAGAQNIGSVGGGACTSEGNGYHTYAPAQAETNYDLIAFTFTGTGAVPVTVQVFTRHDANLTHLAGTAYTAGAIPAAAAGAAGGLVIAGSNAATTFATLTVTGATTLTGNVAMQAGLTITQSTLNGHGISITGNGTGEGITVIGGDTGIGLVVSGGATAAAAAVFTASGNNNAISLYGSGSGSALFAYGGETAGAPAVWIAGQTATSDALKLDGGASAAGLLIDTVSVTGTTTLTGAVTASNASNNIVGIDVAKVGGTAQTAGDLAAMLTVIDDFLDTEIAAIKVVTDQFTAAQAEPTAAPTANATPLVKLAWIAALARNKILQTATTQTLRADDGSTPIATSAVSDDGVTFTREKWA